MTRIKSEIWMPLLMLVMGVSSCGQKAPEKQAVTERRLSKDKVYKGGLHIAADTGLEPVMKQEVEVFSFSYDSVDVKIEYKNTEEMMNAFRTGKAGVIISTTALTDADKESLKKKDTIYTRELKLAYDAVALIGNNKFNDASLSMDRLKGYFDPESKSPGGLKMVFEGQNSSTVRYVIDKLGFKQKVSPNIYALRSVDEVIDYVEKNENVIGFIPFSFVSDMDDDYVKKALKRIKILSLRSENSRGEAIRVSANQSDIAEGAYPLTRAVYAVSKYGYGDSLEWLFVNFLQKERGARIFLKAGLIPARMPEREINVNMESVKGGN